MLKISKSYTHEGVPTTVSLELAGVPIADMLVQLDSYVAGNNLEEVQAPKKRAPRKKKEDKVPTETVAPPAETVAPTPIPEPVAGLETAPAPVAAPAPVVAPAPVAAPAPNPNALATPVAGAPIQPSPVAAPAPQVEMAPPTPEVDAMADGWRASIKNSITAIKGGVGAALHGDVDAVYVEALRSAGYADVATVEQADYMVDQLPTSVLQGVYQALAEGTKNIGQM